MYLLLVLPPRSRLSGTVGRTLEVRRRHRPAEMDRV